MPSRDPEDSDITIVIVEDEERARITLRNLVSEDSDLRLLAETSGHEAPDIIQRVRPDILLLDIQMPGVDGLEVMRRIAPACQPVVIFVTAYDHYALDAFSLAAVDYLLKPFSDDRFAAALARAKAQARLRRSGLEPGAGNPGKRHAPARLTLRDGVKTIFLSPEEIDWIQADGVYVRVFAGQRRVLVRESLTAMEAQLCDAGFVRIHRSALVNVARVVELKHRSHGDYIVLLRDGTELTVSRTRKTDLERSLRI